MSANEIEIFFRRDVWDGADNTDFDDVSRLLVRRWVAGRSFKRGRWCNDVPWLERTVYRLLALALDSDCDHVDLFVSRCQRYGRDPQQRGQDNNAFQAGIMALFAHDKGAITPRDRERVGKRLWHAYRHFVPVEFLSGFLKQIPSRGLSKRAQAGSIEEGFEGWIVSQLCQAEIEEVDVASRGIYPRDIQQAVKKAVRAQRRRTGDYRR